MPRNVTLPTSSGTSGSMHHEELITEQGFSTLPLRSLSDGAGIEGEAVNGRQVKRLREEVEASAPRHPSNCWWRAAREPEHLGSWLATTRVLGRARRLHTARLLAGFISYRLPT